MKLMQNIAMLACLDNKSHKVCFTYTEVNNYPSVVTLAGPHFLAISDTVL